MMDSQWFSDAKDKNVGVLKRYGKQYAGIRDERGWTALMNATSVNNIENIQYLIEIEQDVYSPTNFTALMIAVERGFVQAARLLMCQKDVRIQSKDPVYKQGTTALAIAMQCQNIPLVSHLLNFEKEVAGLTQMHIDAFYHKSFEIMQACQRNQQQQIDQLKRLPIVYMTFITPTPENEKYYKQALRYMVQLPETFHTHKKDVYGLTAMHYAVIYNNRPAIEVLSPFYQQHDMIIPQTLTLNAQRQPIYWGKDDQQHAPINLKEIARIFQASPPPSSELTQNVISNGQTALRNSQMSVQHNVAQVSSPSPINFNLTESLRESKLSKPNNYSTQQNMHIDQLKTSQHMDMVPNQFSMHASNLSMSNSQDQQQNTVRQNDQTIKSRLTMAESQQRIQNLINSMHDKPRSMIQQLQSSQNIVDFIQTLSKSQTGVKNSQVIDDMGRIAAQFAGDLSQSKIGAAEVTPSFSGVQHNVAMSQCLMGSQIADSSLKEKLRMITSEFKYLEQDNNELQVRHQTALQRIEMQQQLINNLKNQIFELENDKYNHSLNHDKTMQKIQNQRTSMYVLEAQLLNLQNQQDQASEFVVQLQRELEEKTIECDNLREIYDRVNHMNKQLQVEKSIYVDKVGMLQSQLQGAQGQLESVGEVALENTQLYAKVTELQDMNDKLTDELTAQKEENEALEKKLQVSKLMLNSQHLMNEIDKEFGTNNLVKAFTGSHIADRSLDISQLAGCNSQADRGSQGESMAASQGASQVCAAQGTSLIVSGHNTCNSCDQNAVTDASPQNNLQETEILHQKLQEAKFELEALQKRYDELQASHTQLQNLYEALQVELESAETRLEQRRLVVERLETELCNSVSEFDFEMLENQNEALRADNRALVATVRELEAVAREEAGRKEMVLKEFVATKKRLLDAQAGTGQVSTVEAPADAVNCQTDMRERSLAALRALEALDGQDVAQEEDPDSPAALRARIAAAEDKVHRMRAMFKAWMVDLVK